jgi:hypothetical protein
MERNQDATKWFLYSTKKNSTFQEWLYDHLTLVGSAHNRNSRGVENRNTLVSKPVTMRRGALNVDPQFAVGNLKSVDQVVMRPKDTQRACGFQVELQKSFKDCNVSNVR